MIKDNTDLITVSVIVPTYNRKKDLKLCISSILKQDFKNLQIIIIDDCSSNDCIDYIKKEFPSINIIINEKNKGVNYCRNRGIINSVGKYLLFLDSDVELVNKKQISEMIKIMEIDCSIGSLGGIFQPPDLRVWGCNFNGSKIYYDLNKYDNNKNNNMNNKNNKYDNMNYKDNNKLKQCQYVSSGNLFIKRSTIVKYSGFDESIKGDGTECEIGMNLNKDGFFNMINDKIAAKHNMSSVERDNIGINLRKKTYSAIQKQQLRLLYNHRNRLKYFFKNGTLIELINYFFQITARNSLSLLSFIKQQFFGLKNTDSEKFNNFPTKINILIFKFKLLVDPLLWNIFHFIETQKSKKINFLIK